MIPIIVVSYNNYQYVENTIRQINIINPEYYKNIYIMDNNSTDPTTVQFLHTIEDSVKVIYNTTNDGPWVTPTINRSVYDQMPDQFILTDPDLEFNADLPSNFIELILMLSNIFEAHKIGFALRIDDFKDMYPSNHYCQDKNIYEWESQFWINKIQYEDFELYLADIDTTFCLMNKQMSLNSSRIRIAGNFTARHLPWYITNPDILSMDEKYHMYHNQTNISTIAKVVMEYIHEHYPEKEKNNI